MAHNEKDLKATIAQLGEAIGRLAAADLEQQTEYFRQIEQDGISKKLRDVQSSLTTSMNRSRGTSPLPSPTASSGGSFTARSATSSTARSTTSSTGSFTARSATSSTASSTVSSIAATPTESSKAAAATASSSTTFQFTSHVDARASSAATSSTETAATAAASSSSEAAPRSNTFVFDPSRVINTTEEEHYFDSHSSPGRE